MNFGKLTTGLWHSGRLAASQRLFGAVPVVLKSQMNLLSTSAIVKQNYDNVHPGYFKIRETYKKYQVEDGVPVYLKAGTRDYILYYFTLILVIGGALLTFYEVYCMAVPKNKQFKFSFDDKNDKKEC